MPIAQYFKLVLVLVFLFVCFSVEGQDCYDGDDFHPDYEALHEIYINNGGPGWSKKARWDSCDPCTFEGVKCTKNRVTDLNLSGIGLKGAFTLNLATLPMLVRIDLSENQLTGPFPFGDPHHALHYLNLSSNNFLGCIPEEYRIFCDIKNQVFLENNSTVPLPRFKDWCEGRVGDLDAPAMSCPAESFLITAPGGYATYNWEKTSSGPSVGFGRSAASNTFLANSPGTYSVTVTSEDCGTLIDSITVAEDRIAPTARCAEVITVGLNSSGSVSIDGQDLDDNSSDNCGSLMYSASKNFFKCSDIGPNTVILTVTDENSNMATCVSTVRVEDNIDPVAECQDITVSLGGDGRVNIVAGSIDNGSTDNCGDVSLSAVPNILTCSNLGINNVVLTVNDGNGQTDACTSRVRVEDNMDPVAECQDITVSLGGDGRVNIVAGSIDNGSTDNCGDVSLSAVPNILTCSNLGINNVVLTVNDGNGQTDACTSRVRVEDNMDPVAECQDITVSLGGDGRVNIVAGSIDNGSTDNCGDVSLSATPTDFTCSNLGINNVVLTVNDGNGQTDACTSRVRVEDNMDPVAECQDITVSLGGDGRVTIVAGSIDNGSTDNCGDVSLSAVPNILTCSNLGINNVVLTVNDGNGQTDVCTSRVRVEDNMDPVAECLDITVSLGGDGRVSIVAGSIDNGSTDNCGDVSLSAVPNIFTCSNLGINNVVLTVNDGNGQTDACTSRVRVEDNMDPVAECQDITVSLGGDGRVSIVAGSIDNGSTDNCGDVSLSATPTDFTCSNLGINNVVLTVNDGNGQTNACTSRVRVEDNMDPVAECQDITVSLGGDGRVNIVAGSIDNGSIDNCGDVSLSAVPNIFTCSNLGINNVVLTVNDGNGQTDACTSRVRVEDNMDPVAECLDITVSLGGDGRVSIVAGSIDNSSTDNCGDVSLSATPTDFTCSNLGINNVVLTVNDGNGQTDACTSRVRVEDNMDPVAECLDITVSLGGDGRVSIVAGSIDNGSTDNCGDVSLSATPTDFTCSNLGINNVVLTVNDGNGQTDACTSRVRVEDNMDPVAECQDITVSLGGDGRVTIVAGSIDNGSTDNCGDVSLSAVPNILTCSNLGINNVVLTVNDGNGQTDACTSKVKVEDNVAPKAECKDITIELDLDGNVTILASAINNGSSDNCDDVITSASTDIFTCSDIGTIDVELTVDDGNGQSSTCISKVKVEDNEAPVAECKNITVELNSSGNVSIEALDIDDGSSDNCSVILSASRTLFTCADIGTIDVELTVGDGNGQSSACISKVSVEDNIDPVAACKDITVELNSSGNISIEALDIDDGSSDNCSVSLDASRTVFTCSDIGTVDVVLTVDDGNGQIVNCSSKVEVEDNIAPEANCQDITVQLDGSGNVSIEASDLDDESSDNCNDISLLASQLAFTCSDIGTIDVELTVDDGNGQSSTCISKVKVEDNEAPVAECKDITIELNTSGDVSIEAVDIDDGSSDNCSISLSASRTTFTCEDIGTIDVELTVDDGNGQSSTCTSKVIVEDNIDPVAACKDITVELNSSGNISIEAVDIDDGSSDNCSVILSASRTVFTCSDIGTVDVVLTVDDGNGQIVNCSSKVEVEDNIAPEANCQDITVQLDGSGNISIVASDLDNGSTDNCNDISLLASQLSFTCSDIGTIDVELTVDDGNGQSSTCISKVKVEDNEAPVAECKDITIELNFSGDVSIEAVDIDDGSSDNCNISLSASLTTFTCEDIGTIDVELTVDDGNGQSSTCISKVRVEDNIDPVAACKDITVELNSSGNISIEALDIDDGSSDNCSVSLDASRTVFTCSDIGTVDVVLTVDDGNGQIVNCSSKVEVEDNIAPEANCQDITVQLDGSGNISIVASDLDNGSTDNCNDISLLASQLSFTCSDIGTIDVELTVDDGNGQSSTCISKVKVEDNEAPVAECKDITIELNFSGDVSIEAVDIDDGSSDNCNISLSASLTTFTCEDIGTIDVELTVDDGNGQSSTCISKVRVEDNIDPVAACKDITVELNSSGNISIEAVDIDDGSSDNCSVILSASRTVFTCSDIGTVDVVLTVDDGNGQIVNCSSKVEVEDNIAPEANCQDITVQLDGSGNISIVASDLDNGSTDNCNDISLLASQLASTCSDIGTIDVELTVDDGNGQSSTCISKVKVEDNEAPVAECKDITIELNFSGDVSIEAVDIDDGSSDNCNISLSASLTTFTCEDIGTIDVELTVNDGNGQSSTCISKVRVEDNIDPVAACKDITIELNTSGDVSIEAVDIDHGSSDNCSVILSASRTVFTCADIGTVDVVLTVDDGNGQIVNCSSKVEVEDNIAPEAKCEDITVQLDESGNISIVASDLDNGSTDNCNDISLLASQLAFTCSDIGTIDVELTVDDGNGQSSTCISKVKVEDNIDPVAACKDITVELNTSGDVSIEAMDINDGSSDNCSVTLSASRTVFTCADIGTIDVELTVDDGNGQSSTCISKVRVEDNIDPVAACKDITVELNSSGNISIEAVDIDDGSSDNCSVILSASRTVFTCSDIGTVDVVLTVDDGNGQIVNCSSKVEVEDNIAPEANCQDITVQLDGSGNVSIVASDLDDESSDNCNDISLLASQLSFTCSDIGTIDVELTVDDGNGQSSTCISKVKVEDNEAPVAECKDITIELNTSGDVSIEAVDIDDGSSDNCSISLSASLTTFTCEDIGTIDVELTVDDGNGQSSTCISKVRVEDNIDPVAACKDITVELNTSGDVSIEAMDINDGSSDNCSVILSASRTVFTCADIGTVDVILTVDDGNGQIVTCISKLEVEDNVAPIAICHDITVELDGEGNLSVTAEEINNESSDACSAVTLSLNKSLFDCSQISENIVTLTVSDASGNESTCSAVVTVEDKEKPEIICPSTLTVNTDPGTCTYDAGQLEMPRTSDNCSVQTLVPNMLTLDLGINSVKWTVTDGVGLTSSCTQQVIVEDNQPPVITCPASIVVNTDENSCSASSVALIAAIASDNCTDIEPLHNAPPTFPIGITEVIWRAVDSKGLAAECIQLITVEDNEKPIIACPDDITVSTDTDQCFASGVQLIQALATDNCGEIFPTNDAPESFPLEKTVVKWTANDGNGQSADCEQIVTVEDTQSPEITCPTDITVGTDSGQCTYAASQLVAASAADNCTISPIIDFSPKELILGTNQVTWIATDDRGLEDLCIQNIVVEDNEAPEIQCPSSITVLADRATCTFAVQQLEAASATDNCSIDPFIQFSPSILELGIQEITWTAQDDHGQLASCKQSVTVERDMVPDIFVFNVCTGKKKLFDGEEYGVGTHIGKYKDNCILDFQITIVETDLIEINVTKELCFGETITYLGQSYDKGGQYYLGEEVGDCDFVEYLNIKENAGNGGQELLLICEGSSVEINGTEVSSSGVFESDICGESIVAEVIVLEKDTLVIVKTINSKQYVTIEGQKYTETGEYEMEVGSNAGCSATLILKLNVEECGGSRTITESLCSGEKYQFFEQEILTSGTYTHNKVLGVGCDSIIVLEIEFDKIPPFEIAGPDRLCQGDTIVLSGPEGLEYLWSNGSRTRDIVVTRGGSYDLYVRNTNGCTEFAAHSVEEFSFPGTVDIARTSPTNCDEENGSLVVKVAEPDLYHFSVDGGITWQNSNEFNNLGPGEYSVLLSDLNQTCIRSVAIPVTLSQKGIPDIAGIFMTEANACTGDLGRLEILSVWDSELQYSIDGGASWSTSNIFENLSAGFYAIQVSPTNSSCINDFIDSMEVKSLGDLQFSILTAREVSCTDENDAILKVEIENGLPPYNYLWSNGSQSEYAIDLGPGEYEVTVTDANSCIEVLSIEVANVDLQEVVNQFQDTILCINDTITYNNLDSGYNYVLFKDDQFIQEGIQLQIIETGHYQVIADRGDACFVDGDFIVENPDTEDLGLDFLLSSKAIVGEGVVVVNISDPMPETSYWHYDSTMIETEVIDSMSHRMIFQDTGIFQITYQAEIDACMTNLSKSIVVYRDSTSFEAPEEEQQFDLPRMLGWQVSPNPNSGEFTVRVNLGQKGPISISIYNMFAAKIDERISTGASLYKERFYKYSLSTGIYSIILEHEGKMYQKSILIIK